MRNKTQQKKFIKSNGQGKRDRTVVENDGENGGVGELWVENEIGFGWIGLGW